MTSLIVQLMIPATVSKHFQFVVYLKLEQSKRKSDGGRPRTISNEMVEVLNSLAPSFFLAFFIRFSNIHSYSTRQSSRLLLPRVKSNFGKNTFLFSRAKIFNELPTNITKAKDIQTFCHRAKGFLLS